MSIQTKINEQVYINVKRLLQFFDEITQGSEGHATAIVAVCGEDLGIGLLRHYFESQGYNVQIARPCTQGTKKGKRLDCWMRIKSCDEEMLYQIEIKNWSAHAIGGAKLLIDTEQDAYSNYKITQWKRLWDDKLGIKHENLTKVIIPMKPPQQFAGIQIEPLACIWTAIHPTGDDECIFNVDLPEDGWCRHLWFFSMSSYLRSIKESVIKLNMPDTRKRIFWLADMIKMNMEQ